MNNGEFYLQDAIEVIEEILSGGGEFRMYPKGTSMLPLIRQGSDSVVLKRNTEKAAKRYDIAFYRRTNGQFVLHRVMKIENNGSYTMCGDNQTALEKGITEEQIIGYVCVLYRGEKQVNFNSFAYKAYVRLYCFMPLRKAVRLLKRVASTVIRRIFRKNKKSADQ